MFSDTEARNLIKRANQLNSFAAAARETGLDAAGVNRAYQWFRVYAARNGIETRITRRYVQRRAAK